MSKKFSASKKNKMLDLYLQGFTQAGISKQLHIDQSTVSKYVGKFKALSEQKGVDIASLKFDVQDEMDEVQSVVAEFKDSDLTMADVEIALQTDKLLQKYGVKREEYHGFIQVCKKTVESGYLDVAIKLNDLENKTGMSYEDIVENAAKTDIQLKKSQGALDSVKKEINAFNLELAEIGKKTKKASADLKKHMQQTGVDEERLEKIEPLALVLNDASVQDQDLPAYIERQKSLNKAGISLGIFSEMLEKFKVSTKVDHGKKLLNLLSEYCGLTGVISEYHGKKQALTQEVGDLEQKVKTKDKLTSEIKIQAAVKANLETDVTQLQKNKVELGNVTSLLQNAQEYNKKQNDENAKLEKEITEKQATRDSLENEIKTKEQKVSDLSEVESKRSNLLNEISGMENKVSKEKKSWQIYEGFLGLVQAKTKEELKQSFEVYSSLIEEMDEKKYPPESLKDLILKELAGSTLQVLKCQSCHDLTPFLVPPAS